MRREIYTAIAEAKQRKPNAAFIIPIKVNECQIEDYEITPMTNMRDLWYADFSKDIDKAYSDLLKRFSNSEKDNSIDISESSESSQLISLRRDDNSSLSFQGYLIDECSDFFKWKYYIYKTADTVKECDYIIHIDRTAQSAVLMHGILLYEVVKYDSLDSVSHDLFQRIQDEGCRTQILELLGIVEPEYLE